MPFIIPPVIAVAIKIGAALGIGAMVVTTQTGCPGKDPTSGPTPGPDVGNPPIKPEAGILDSQALPDSGPTDSFVSDSVDTRPDIRDVYIPPDTGPTDAGLPDIGFTDSGLDAGTPDLGVMDAGRPPCNPTNLEAFDGYDDNCNGNNNTLSEMKQVSIFFEELARRGTGRDRKVIAMGDINNDGYGDLALGAPTLGAVWVYLEGRDSPQLTHYEPGSTIIVKSNMGMGWGLELTSTSGQTTTLPASRGFVIHEDYSENTMGLGDELAVVRVTNPITSQRHNELWIGADAFNHSYGSGAGNRLDTGAIFRLDARGSNPVTRMVSHAIAGDLVALAALNISVILGEPRQGPANNPTRPGSILGSEIIPAGDINGFPNGADEVVLPYFQQKRVAIGSVLAVTQPSQRIQTIVDLLNQQGYLIEGGLYFARTDSGSWVFGDVDGDGKNDMIVGNPGHAVLDQGAGRVKILTNGNLWPLYPQTFDPMDDSTLPTNVWRMTFLGTLGTTTMYTSSLGYKVSAGNIDNDSYDDVAAGAIGTDQVRGALYTFRGSEIRQRPSGTMIAVNGPAMGGRRYDGQNMDDGFTSGGIVRADTDGNGLDDFVAGTLLRRNGSSIENGGLDLICGNSRMGNGQTMSSTVTQGSVTSLACERMYGPTGARIGRVNQNVVYDLNNDGTDEIGTCDEQAKCYVLLGGR